MQRGVLIVLVLLGASAIVLPWRFGIAWLTAPALVLGLLGLSGVMRAYDSDAGEPEVDPLLAEHGVKLLALSGLLCIIGIIGGIRSCQAEGPATPSPDYVRERSRTPPAASELR